MLNLRQKKLLRQYEKLESHGYTLANIHDELQNFNDELSEIGKKYLQGQFKYWMSYEPHFNIYNVWPYVEKQTWAAKLYPSMDSFLWECAFRNVKSEHVYEFIQAASKYEETFISFPRVVSPDQRGKLKQANTIIADNGFGIVDADITQNYRGTLASIKYKLEPSPLVGASTLRNIMRLEGYEVEGYPKLPEQTHLSGSESGQ